MASPPSASSWSPLLPGEIELSPTDRAGEFLYRQAHPVFVRDGRVGSQIFSIDRETSVARGSKTTPQQAYEDFIADGFRTAGTYAVTVGDACELPDVRVVDDSALPGRRHHHSYIDFRLLTSKQRQRRASKLRNAAERNGRLYP